MLTTFHWFWFILFLNLSSLRDVEAQFPRVCTTPEALQNRTCCPLLNGYPCGQHLRRGYCTDLPIITRGLEPIDYRLKWPHAFYDSVCKCLGNYDGFDCSLCLPGWKGPHCQEKHHVKRKEITDLTDTERTTFLSSLDRAKQTISRHYVIFTSNNATIPGNYKFKNASTYDLYVWLHYYAAKPYFGTDNDSAHRGPAFLFWHRVFLLFIEREIRLLTGNEDFYIPYWDWTRTDHCNICNNKYFGAVGPDGYIDSGSIFSRWQTICPYDRELIKICPAEFSPPIIRFPGGDPSANTLPTVEDVCDTLKRSHFDTAPYNRHSEGSFRNTLEGFELPTKTRHLTSSMHNLVHDYFNGTMSYLPTAANDPLFMVHHSFVDKILDFWLTNHPDATYPDSDLVHPAQRKDAYMAPYLPLRTNGYYWTLSITDLGYSYVEHSVPHPAIRG